jgi:hypothetical protein
VVAKFVRAAILITDLFPPIRNRKNCAITAVLNIMDVRAQWSVGAVNPLGRILLRNDTSGSKNKTGQQAFKGASGAFCAQNTTWSPAQI